MHRNTALRMALLCALAVVCAVAGIAQQPPQTASRDVLIRNATILTATRGRIPNGSVLVRNGKIAQVGTNIAAPAGVTVIDAGGKYLTPGIIDSHSHIALDGDVNEATNPIVPHMMMVDAFDYTDRAIYRALAGGVTSTLLMHGSADMIGGQSVAIKTKFGMQRDQLLFPGAPQSIKFASGENPKRVFGSRNQLPATRMGNFQVMRQSFLDAQDYMRQWDAYNEKVKTDKSATQPKRDLKLEALADILRGKLLVQVHCYRADEFLTEMAIAKEFGYKVRAFHHALEAYKVADKIAAEGVAISGFVDWWGYKHEAWDAIPWNPVLSMRKGVKVAIHSDSEDYIRRLNLEAGKAMRYGGATEEEALQMLTINGAWVMGVDSKTGSIDVGKDADLVIWNGYPMSSYGVAEKVFIDGELWFDRNKPGYGLTHGVSVPEGDSSPTKSAMVPPAVNGTAQEVK